MWSHPQQKLQCAIQVGAAPFRLEEQDLADYPQHVLPALARWNEFFDLVGEQNQPHLVVVANCGKRQHRRDFRSQFAFGLFTRSEEAGTADIYHQHQC